MKVLPPNRTSFVMVLKETGGTIGFYCAHQYAHTRKITENLMPYALKGIDATIFSVFQALGMKVTVRPILGEEAFDEYKESVEERWYEEREDDFDDYETFLATQPEVSRVGNKFHKMKMADGQLEGGDNPTPVRKF